MSSDTKVPLIPPTDTPSPGGDEWGTKVHSVGLEIDLDPAIPVHAMRVAIITSIRDSILAGERPDGKGAQKALGAKAAAVPGRQSPYRGYRTGVLADGIRSSRIKTSGTKASTKVMGPQNRNVYLAQEKKKGINYITGAGKVAIAAKEAALQVMKEVLAGQAPKVDRGEEEAGDL